MDTLVLSKTWEADRVVTWQKAMSLLWSGRAEIVEEHEDRYVRSVTVKFQMPSVIRFVSGMRHRNGKIKFSRQNVYSRDKGLCQYCSTRVNRGDSTFDHVVPKSKGGLTTWENIVISCYKCNQKKGNKSCHEARMFPKNKPVRPTYLPDMGELTFSQDNRMPESWKNYIREQRYWNVALEQDGEED